MPNPSFRLIITAAAAVTLFGCSSSRTLAVGDSPVGGSNPDIITRSEIATTNLANADEVVQLLRPRWLRTPRASNSLSGGSGLPTLGGGVDLSGDRNAGPNRVQVYLDGVRIGTIDQLRSLPAPSVEQMQWLDGTSAVSRFGTGNDAGVILITSRRG